MEVSAYPLSWALHLPVSPPSSTTLLTLLQPASRSTSCLGQFSEFPGVVLKFRAPELKFGGSAVLNDSTFTFLCCRFMWPVLRRSMSKDEPLVDGLPKEYYDDVRAFM